MTNADKYGILALGIIAFIVGAFCTSQLFQMLLGLGATILIVGAIVSLVLTGEFR